MPTFSLASIKKIYFKDRLKFIELACLSLFLAFLPSLEGPKNIFLAGYLITALYRQSQLPSSKWTIWDWVFLSLIFSSFLSALFPFVAGGSEWKSFRGMLLWIAFGWTLYRSDYNEKEKKYLSQQVQLMKQLIRFDLLEIILQEKWVSIWRCVLPIMALLYY
jgi:hypothetical protein